MVADRLEQLREAEALLSRADELLWAAGYPNEARVLQSLVVAVRSHRSNAEAKCG